MLSRPIRLLFCITDLDSAGPEQALVEIVTRLDASTFVRQVVVLSGPPPAQRDHLVRRLQDAEIDVRFLHVRSVFHSWRCLRGLGQEIRDFRPDVVQSFLHHANVSTSVAARFAGRPPVVTGIRVAEQRRNLHRYLARRTDRLIAKHVCVSQAVADFATSGCGLPREKLIVIPNGVDVFRFGTAPPADLTAIGVPSGHAAIVFVGRLDRQKRLGWLIERMPAIISQLPLHDLLLVGDGLERTRLEQIAADLGVKDRVHFVGWSGDIPAILRAAKIFVLTSSWEGMPNVLLEAMAAELPIVMTRCEGASELLAGETLEQMVAHNDSDGFVDRIVRFAQDPAQASRLGRANRRRAEQFSWNASTESYAKLYRKLATANRPTC